MGSATKVTYKATGKVDTLHKTIDVSAQRYDVLLFLMELAVRKVRYTTSAVNSYRDGDGPLHEAYTNDLVWPEIRWEIEQVKSKPRVSNGNTETA